MMPVAVLLLAASSAAVPHDALFVDGFERGPDNCATGSPVRMSLADFFYPSGDGGSNPSNPPTRYNVDVTLFENIWGHFTSTDATLPWPGRSGALPVYKAFGRNEYVAAAFHVPLDTSPNANGNFTHANYYGGPPIDASISQVCGDFNPPDAACRVTNVPYGRSMLSWTASPHAGRCVLTPGSDYYINIKLTNPAASDSNCNRITCNIGVVSYTN